MTEYVHVPHQHTLSELTRERDELRKENEALRAALKTYGEHSEGCAYNDSWRSDCNCGLAEALKGWD